MSGVIIGLRDLYFSTVVKDDSTGTTYATPKLMAAAVNAKIKPNTSSATLYANDVAIASANSLGSIDVELEIDQLKADVVKELLGVTQNADGVMQYDDNAVAPYAAIMFRSQLAGGGFRYVALTKGMFTLPEDDYASKSDKVDLQTKKITGTFITREYDGVWKFEVDSNDVTDQTVIDNWFKAVYTPAVG